ncbi:hypothetical protein ABZS66_55535 [Dactylosporangium sp. NPDC005572]|uniref:hypothetical protein n=1 Tax=Dactylosporangium sp. NPDC005572 TaxID=3156889 RepID=UPI0033A70D61
MQDEGRPVADRPEAAPGRPATRRPGHRRRADVVAVVALLVSVPVVHPVGPLLRSPYWLDESWVALAAKARLADLPWVSASSPLGWTLLVWALPEHGQIHRLVAYLFLAGSVVAAYALARTLAWPSRSRAVTAGLFAGAATLLVPAQLMRHDLKQYTADAAVALLLLATMVWAESNWSRRRLAVTGGAVVTGMLVSHPAALVGGAVLGGLLVAAACSRRPDRLRAAALTAAATAGAAAVVHWVVDRPAQNHALSDYWSGYFPSLETLPAYLGTRLDLLRAALGAPWQVVVALAVLGVVAVARMGRPATATALVLLPVTAVAAGLASLYPLLDQRTSHYLLVTVVAVAGIGVVYATSWVARDVVVAGLLVAALTLYAAANRAALVHQPAPGAPAEDVRAQVTFVAGHRGPGDVVLVNFSGQYGFAYYWDRDRPLLRRGGPMATGWYVEYPADARILIAGGRDAGAVGAAVSDAERLAGACGRIWLVRSHVNPDEADAWRTALLRRDVQVVPVGPEPVAVVTAGPQC